MLLCDLFRVLFSKERESYLLLIYSRDKLGRPGSQAQGPQTPGCSRTISHRCPLHRDAGNRFEGREPSLIFRALPSARGERCLKFQERGAQVHWRSHPCPRPARRSSWINGTSNPLGKGHPRQRQCLRRAPRLGHGKPWSGMMP